MELTTYKIVTSAVSIVIGVLVIIFRKQIADAQKQLAAKHTGFIFERVASRSRPSSYSLLILVGTVFIALAFLQLFWM